MAACTWKNEGYRGSLSLESCLRSGVCRAVVRLEVSGKEPSGRACDGGKFKALALHVLYIPSHDLVAVGTFFYETCTKCDYF